MKVTLISAPRMVPQMPAFPPVGLSYIGAVAALMGHKMEIIEAA